MVSRELFKTELFFIRPIRIQADGVTSLEVKEQTELVGVGQLRGNNHSTFLIH